MTSARLFLTATLLLAATPALPQSGDDGSVRRDLEAAGEAGAEALERAGSALATGAERLFEGAGPAFERVGDLARDLGAAIDRNLFDRPISALEGMAVVGSDDTALGEVVAVVRDDATAYAVVRIDDASGLGERDVLVPLDRFRVTAKGDLLLPDATEATLAGYAAYDGTGFERLGGEDRREAAPATR